MIPKARKFLKGTNYNVFLRYCVVTVVSLYYYSFFLPCSVIQEQIKLRENALAQSEMLMEYKRAFTHQHDGLMSIFVSLLAEPLSKTGPGRTEMDHLTIELVLHLFRNLLSAEPILKGVYEQGGTTILYCILRISNHSLYFCLSGSSETSQASLQLHNDLIVLFEKELVLDILYVIAQEMEARENAQYNLLLMELLHHLLRNQDPTAVARASNKPKPSNKKAPPLASKSAAGRPAKTTAVSKKPAGSLSAQLQREKIKLRPPTTSRHSHFGGTLVVNRLDGKRQYMSAALQGTSSQHSRPEAQKRKNRKTDPFIGNSKRQHYTHQVSNKAQRTLHAFCSRFVQDCYGPLMKSLKNEFRRDSVRLEGGDKVVLFRIIWFFSQWWRVTGRKESPSNDKTALGQLIFTMDVFTFNLVLNATDFYQQHKKYLQLAQAVALYSEMMQLLLIMYNSKDSTEQVMALGLLDRLFYGSDPLDRLPKLLSKWTAGTLTREYACDLVELVHVTLKLLEANGSSVVPVDTVDKKKKKKKADNAVARMKQTAAEFDLLSYVVRKIISNQTIFMYTHVLSQYISNAPHVNHHIVALFVRMMKLHIAMPDDEDDETRGDVPKNPFAVKPSTLEPMLYNIQLFCVMDQVLNDATIRKEREYTSLLSFATCLMSRFAKHSQDNNLAFVECLFRHPAPHRYCELTTNLYVNEELRMLAERELLLEEHERLAQAEGDEDDELDEALFRRHSGRPSTRSGTQAAPTQARVDDGDDEEVEWDDGESTDKQTKAAKVNPFADDSDDDEEEKVEESPSAEKKTADEMKQADSLDVEKEAVAPNTEKDNEASDVEMEDDLKVGSKEGSALPTADTSDSEKKNESLGMEKDDDENESGVATEDAVVSKADKSSVDENDEKAPESPVKRKLLSDIDGNSLTTSPQKKTRIEQKPVDDESSDEELGFDTQAPVSDNS